MTYYLDNGEVILIICDDHLLISKLDNSFIISDVNREQFRELHLETIRYFGLNHKIFKDFVKSYNEDVK